MRGGNASHYTMPDVIDDFVEGGCVREIHIGVERERSEVGNGESFLGG